MKKKKLTKGKLFWGKLIASLFCFCNSMLPPILLTTYIIQKETLGIILSSLLMVGLFMFYFLIIGDEYEINEFSYNTQCNSEYYEEKLNLGEKELFYNKEERHDGEYKVQKIYAVTIQNKESHTYKAFSTRLAMLEYLSETFGKSLELVSCKGQFDSRNNFDSYLIDYVFRIKLDQSNDENE